jgi:hypothetical protein
VREHLIRLRGGWELHDPAAADPGPTRLTLPTVWDARHASRPLRLVRKFRGPKVGNARIDLAIEAVHGLRAMSLNGEPLGFDVSATGPRAVALPPLRERNELELVLELAVENAGDGPPWGRIALVIHEHE